MMMNGRANIDQDRKLTNIKIAKNYVQSGCGLEEPELLSESFVFEDPLRGSQKKKEYIQGLEKLDLKVCVCVWVCT